MSKFFVSKTDVITVEVFVWEENGNFQATHDKKQVPADAKSESISFTFKKPAFSQSNEIMRQSHAGEGKIDAIAFQDSVIRQLLTDWSCVDDNGTKIPVNITNVNNLEPSIARAAVEGALEKIKL